MAMDQKLIDAKALFQEGSVLIVTSLQQEILLCSTENGTFCICLFALKGIMYKIFFLATDHILFANGSQRTDSHI